MNPTGTGDVARFASVDAAKDHDYFVRFVDEANRFPSVLECKRKLTEALKLAPGQQVLEGGCGTGDDARALGKLVGAQGRVTGVDLSEVMVRESQRRGAGEHGNVEFRQADLQQLPFADATFDRCRIERVLMHVPDAALAVAEVARVLKPGGRVAIFDFDWDAVVIPHPDTALTRRIVHGVADSIRHAHIGRFLPRYLREAGLKLDAPVPHSNLPPFGFFRRIMEGATAALVERGVIPADERNRWWDQLEELERRGDWFCGFTGFVFAAQKP